MLLGERDPGSSLLTLPPLQEVEVSLADDRLCDQLGRPISRLGREASKRSDTEALPVAAQHPPYRRGQRYRIVPRLDRGNGQVRLELVSIAEVAASSAPDQNEAGDPADRAEALPVEVEQPAFFDPVLLEQFADRLPGQASRSPHSSRSSWESASFIIAASLSGLRRSITSVEPKRFGRALKPCSSSSSTSFPSICRLLPALSSRDRIAFATVRWRRLAAVRRPLS
jgi:hypothetical protein